MAFGLLVIQPWDGDLDVPYLYVADANLYRSEIKGILEHGWCWYNPDLGAPAGQQLFDFPGRSGDPSNVFLIKVIGLFSSGSGWHFADRQPPAAHQLSECSTVLIPGGEGPGLPPLSLGFGASPGGETLEGKYLCRSFGVPQGPGPSMGPTTISRNRFSARDADTDV